MLSYLRAATNFLGRPDPEFIDRTSCPFPFDKAYLIHFNYIVGRSRKIQLMKKYGAIFSSMLAAEDGS